MEEKTLETEVERAQRVARADSRIEYAIFGSRQVLFLEDEPAMAIPLYRALEERGLSVTLTPSGDIAEKILYTEGSGIDLLISDASVRGSQNGESLCEKLLAKKPDFPIIGRSAGMVGFRFITEELEKRTCSYATRMTAYDKCDQSEQSSEARRSPSLQKTVEMAYELATGRLRDFVSAGVIKPFVVKYDQTVIEEIPPIGIFSMGRGFVESRCTEIYREKVKELLIYVRKRIEDEGGEIGKYGLGEKETEIAKVAYGEFLDKYRAAIPVIESEERVETQIKKMEE